MTAAKIPALHFERRPNFVATEPKWKAMFDLVARKAGSGFLFAVRGARGTGKTQMAVKMIVDAAKAGRTARYVRVMDLFRELRDSMETHRECEVFSTFATPALLVIDELQVRSNTAWEQDVLENLIDNRYGECRDTLLISNLTEPEFAAAIGASILSRIQETGALIACTWPSFRGKR